MSCATYVAQAWSASNPEPSHHRNRPITFVFVQMSGGTDMSEPDMADSNRLRGLAHQCVQAAVDADDPATTVMLLDIAHRFLDRASIEGVEWELGRGRTDRSWN